MITLTKIRDLDLAGSPEAEKTYLSAASGLVRIGTFLYVVADDELHLAVFRTTESGPGDLVRLFHGMLPVSPRERKKQKPDLESLTLLPASREFPNGAILALGSGSTRNRRRGAMLRLDAQGAVQGLSEPVDLSPIFDPLDEMFPKLNIEGAAVSGDEMRLFQRGNKRNSENAIIRFPLLPLLDVLNGKAERTIPPIAVHPIDLGEIDGIPFCFTDAAALPDGDMVFTAVAEDTEDTYNDGPCVAAAIGIVDRGGQLHQLLPLSVPLKVEGVDARVEGDVIRLLLVTDADDPAIPAALFSAAMDR